jgi:GntR family transcriptional repressor for pyruvate dehydrogenase complex
MSIAVPQKSIGPSRKSRIADDLYDALLAMIDEEFAPGARLPPEVSIAARFGVSRPTLRETLARMRVDGRIVSKRGSGSYVSEHGLAKPISAFSAIDSLQQIKNCYEFRAAFEVEAAGRAAQERDEVQLVLIQRALERLKDKLEDREAGPELDFDFHLAIARACANPWYGDALTAIKTQIETVIKIGRQLSLTKPVAHLQTIHEEHQLIVDAIARKDTEAARALMLVHLNRGKNRIFSDPPG